MLFSTFRCGRLGITFINPMKHAPNHLFLDQVRQLFTYWSGVLRSKVEFMCESRCDRQGRLCVALRVRSGNILFR
jgi:hypothetical protein